MMSLISRAVSHGDDQAGADLAQLDPVGDFDDAVEHAQAGVADVVDRGVAADAEIGGDPAGRGRLEVFAADPAIDQGLRPGRAGRRRPRAQAPRPPGRLLERAGNLLPTTAAR